MQVHFALLLPEFLLAGLGVLVLAADLALPHRWEARRNAMGATIAVVGMLAVAGVALATQWDTHESLAGGLFVVDRYGLAFKTLFLGAGVAVALMSVGYVGARIRHPGEFYALLIFSALGAVLVAGAGELLTAYISLEVLSFSLYVLVALSRGDRRSAEAGTKYILLGALSSAIMLFGIGLLYGVSGDTTFRAMSAALATDFSATAIVGFSMFVAGLGFKLAAVPFHLWAPDAYEGAPTPVTAHLSVLSKAAAVALTLRFLAEAGFAALETWQAAVAVLAALSMTVGTLTALAQRNIKRLLAYSSIAQVGFVLMGVAAMTQGAATAAVLHLAGYAFTNLAAFAVIIALENRADPGQTGTGGEEIADFAGLAPREPFVAAAMTAALFSLAGLPFFAGFVTKFYLFTAVAGAGLLWLVVVAVLNSLISLYYYLMVIKQMYLGTSAVTGPLGVPRLHVALLLVLFAGTVAVGVYPAPFAGAIDAATRSLAPFARP